MLFLLSPKNNFYYHLRWPLRKTGSILIFSLIRVIFYKQTAQNLLVLHSQQDAQEFLRFLLDKLHVEINRRAYVRRTVKEPTQKYAKFR